MGNVIEHEELDGEVFENLERLCLEGRELVAGCREPREERAPVCTERDLARAIGGLPSVDDEDDDDGFSARLA